jgi:hypothetical protein
MKARGMIQSKLDKIKVKMGSIRGLVCGTIIIVSKT